MKRALLLLVPAFWVVSVMANNIHVTNVALTGINTNGHYAMVKFDLSWDNSWHVTSGPNNWDAAWVFIKYRVQGQTSWSHATLHYVNGSGTGDGHLVPADATINSRNDNGGANGVFIYHASPMTQGSVNYSNTALRWDYGANGVADGAQVSVQVFAIEMVYVPEGSFFVGTGGKEQGAFYTYPDTLKPYQITSEAAIPVGPADGQLYYKSGGDDDFLGPIPATFPKGFRAFYCMKYEITQDQYVAFLNSLTQAQSRVRHSGYFSVPDMRVTITSPGPGQYITANPYVPLHGLNYDNICAYLDWSALRLMTELEYEKACRGTNDPVLNEFAWGTNTLTGYNPQNNTSGFVDYTISNAGAIDEQIATNYSPVSGNAMWYYARLYPSLNPGPLRAGIFAANVGNRGRVTSGGSFYGIMELSGNVAEEVMTVNNPDARAYNGHEGNGQLASNGTTDENWPALGTFAVGIRGGGIFDQNVNKLMVSNRAQNSQIAAVSGYPGYGGRGVRTAP